MARRISEGPDWWPPIAVDASLPEGLWDAGPVRLCCAITRLVQGLNAGIPSTGTDLWPPAVTCHCGASRNKESLWGSGCEAS